MASSFPQTIRSLKADRLRHRVVVVSFLLAMIASWLAWFTLARIPVYRVSERARLEVSRVAHPVVSRVVGDVVENRLRLGDEVSVGDVLVRLDDSAPQLALREGQAKAADLERRLEAVDRETAAEERALKAFRKAAPVAVAELESRLREAKARERFAAFSAESFEELRRRKSASAEEYLKAVTESEAASAVVKATQVGIDKLREDQKVQELDRERRLAELQRNRAEVAGQLTVQQTTLARLQHEAEQRVIRSPVSGYVAQTRNFPIGASVATGTTLGYVVPPSHPHVIALFPSSDAGRLRAGQKAQLRLDGFPWLQYGSLKARVQRVASESQDGLLRAELSISDPPSLQIPVEHGLSGSVHVQVERVSPAVLLLRVAGWLLHRQRSGSVRP